LTLSANVENLTLTGSAAINGTGNSLANVLTGNSGANVLDGAAGADTMVGGAGNDSYVVDNVLDVVTEAAGGGTDSVQAKVSYTLGAEVENLTLTGTSAINATGNALANVLTGNSGANVMDGAAGADTMIGGAGNDSYVVDDAFDVVTEAASAGTDLVKASISYTLGANLENLTLTGTGNLNATGNSVANVLTGNAGDNVLNGGTGTDTMLGGAGNDTYVLDVAADIVTEAANSGTDTVQIGVTYTLGANVENLTLTGTSAVNGTGNSLANVLTGNGAANTLDGAAGADTMIGGAGNDTYLVDNVADVVTENTAEGTDLVQASVTYTLGANVENLTLTGSSAINATGNTLANVLTGNSANNTLTGAAGNDTLDGGVGSDTLIGGTGNDIYKLGRGYGTDSIQENDATAGNTDVLQCLSGIATDQLWFRHVGNNLEVSVIGTSDKATLTNWYLGSQYHVEQFKTSGGKTLLDSKVNALVDAMAAFSPPAAGQTTLPAAYQTVLNPVIAANWQ
jgi:Ca2+-binding RTX toxin-like protein